MSRHFSQPLGSWGSVSVSTSTLWRSSPLFICCCNCSIIKLVCCALSRSMIPMFNVSCNPNKSASSAAPPPPQPSWLLLIPNSTFRSYRLVANGTDYPIGKANRILSLEIECYPKFLTQLVSFLRVDELLQTGNHHLVLQLSFMQTAAADDDDDEESRWWSLGVGFVCGDESYGDGRTR